jgi:hypothetical protein
MPSLEKFDKWRTLKKRMRIRLSESEANYDFLKDTAAGDKFKYKIQAYKSVIRCMEHLEEREQNAN